MRTLTTLLLASALLLGGCSTFSGDDDKILPGERVSILELQRGLSADSAERTQEPVAIPPAWKNEFWPQAGGYPNHAMQHLALSEAPLNLVWSISIGKGATKALPLTAQPVAGDGRIFTLDTKSTLSAFAAKDGAKLWQVNIANLKEDDEVIGGGIAYSRGVVFATNGYNEVMALSADRGGLIWRVKIPSVARAAPSIANDRVFVTTLDNRIIALSAIDGKTLWDYEGLAESAGLIGAASPAAGRDVVVPAFSSGEVYALRMENGLVAWSENLSSFGATASGVTSLSDIRGLPIIDKGIVFAISFSGRLLAIDERTGNRIWQREIGSAETPWIAGNALFVLSTENEIAALNKDNGAIFWAAKLPRYKDEEDRKGPLFWTGPVLAGGRLFTAGSNGDMVEINPADGTIIRHWSAGESFSIPPAVANETLYLLSKDGVLSAYR